VNLYHKNEFKEISLSLAHVALRSVRIALHNLAKHSVTEADIVINADTSRYLRDKKMTELISVETIQSMIALGEREAQKDISEINSLVFAPSCIEITDLKQGNGGVEHPIWQNEDQTVRRNPFA